ncbi:hypothetical protein [Planctellipticum variicoloris]|uniref:hypothetical protein n=1 Tax=Planctellipticum variicoloris TaxID=3064265 RepID=UPI003013D40D|nr:hypothetical protein SH412_003562 [Planctomycetaceae bacterium SH412]
MAVEIAAVADSEVAVANQAAAGSEVVVVNLAAAGSAAAAVNLAAADSAAAAANRVEVVSVEEAVRRTSVAVAFRLPQAADASRRQAAVVLSPLPAVVRVGVPWVEGRASRRSADSRRPFIAPRRSRAPARADNPESPVRDRRDRNAVTQIRSTPATRAADVPA